MKKRRASPEYQLHVTVAQYLDCALSIEDGVWWTTFPAGGGGKARGGKLKRAGLKAGVPDILIIDHGRALWIELKSKDGSLSEAQQVTRQVLNLSRGFFAPYVWEQCRSVESVELALRNWGVPLRASVTAKRAVGSYSTAAGAR